MNNGVTLALLGYAIYSWGDGLIKALGADFSVFEIGLFNALAAAAFLLVLKPSGESWNGFWRMKRPWAVHARGICGALAGVLGVYAFISIPMAEVYALFFLAPLFVTILSVIILREQVGPWRWAAVIAGFAGILLVVRPGFRAVELGHVAAIIVALLAALGVILMRSLASEKQTTMLGVLVGYSLLAHGVGVAATGLAVPGPLAIVLFIMTGLCTAAGHRLNLLAARISPANLIAPTHYSQMLWAVIIGALFFQEYPDWLSILGLAVVAASGLLTLVREKVRLGSMRWNPFGRTRL